MIHIDVDLNPPPIDAYVRKNRKALDGQTKVTRFEQELEKARAFFNDPANYSNDEKLTTKSFQFKVYKDAGVQRALIAAYGLKCAYCESDFAAVTPKEIEHFRPKSEIDTCVPDATPLKPGYWWLAGIWKNLLISCVDCNRRRSHEVPGESGPVTLGKLTQFPISTEQSRIRAEGDIAEEELVRLLLHPAIDEPMDYLTFDEDALIHPKDDGHGPDAMGKESIRVYALQRGELVKKRLVVLNDLKLKIEQLLRQVEMHNMVVGTEAEAVSLDQIRSLRFGMEMLLQPGRPYLGMLREHIRREKAAGSFALLEQANVDLEALI